MMRTRVNASVYITPVPYLSLNAGVGSGHDDYTDSGFGLRDSKTRSWSTGFDVAPTDVADTENVALVNEAFMLGQVKEMILYAGDPRGGYRGHSA